MSDAESPTPAPRTSIFNRDLPVPARRAETPVEEKPVVSNTISITVRDGHNDQSFKMKRDRTLAKLMQASAMHLGKEYKSCRFMLDGQRLNENDTPEKLEMDDDDIIEVFTEQIGGNVHVL